ncbi:caspase domain-containing protein [Fibrobacterota bacterium]
MNHTKMLKVLIISGLLIQSAQASRYALVVGRNDGGSDVEDLRYAETDARHFSGLLSSLAEFEADNIKTLINPDSLEIEKELNQFAALFKREKDADGSLFLFYYSGHADHEKLKLGEQGYSLKKIKDYLETFPSSIRIGIFDACQSGAVTSFKGGRLGKPFYLQSQKKVQGQVIIASSAANELAQESESLKGSIFSHHWFNGLRGSADFSGDRKVTLSEAYRYAYRKTVETTALTGGGIQHPSYKFNIHGQGEILLTNLSNSNSGIWFDKSFQGKHLVLSEHYTDVLGDFFKKKDQDVFISLNPGDYTVINVMGTATRFHTFSIGQKQVYRIHQDSMTINPLAINRVKGSNPVVEKSMEYTTSPLSTYSWGLGTGAVSGLTKELQSENDFLKLAFSNSLYIQNNFQMFFDFHWIIFGRNFGGDIGFDYLFHHSRLHPFIGLGAGFAAYDKQHRSFEAELGPSATARLGLLFDISSQVQLQVRVPYTIVLNKALDQTVGFELGLMFSGPFKNVKVLHY